MIWVGVICVGAAVVCFLVARSRKQRVRSMVTTEIFGAKELGTLRDAATDAAGPGTFRYACEITGIVRPGPGGLVKAEMSSTQCVWTRHKITRKYWETERDSDGDEDRVDREQVMSHNRIAPLFAIEDATGQVLVNPGDNEPECAQKVFDKFVEHDEQESHTELKIGSFSLTLPTLKDDGTYGYQYEEWVLTPGQRMFVLGEASDATGSLVVSPPEKGGHFIMSDKDEQQLLREATSSQKAFNIGGIVLAVAGVAATLIDLFQ